MATWADVEIEVLANLALVRADALNPAVEVLLQAAKSRQKRSYHLRNRSKLTSQGCSGRGSMHCVGQQLLDPEEAMSAGL